MSRSAWAILCLSMISGCAAQQAPPAATVAAPTAPGASIAPVANTSGPEALAAATNAFAAAHVSGVMALYDTRDGKLRCSDPARCERGYIPASTFKIANTIIGLETGVIDDSETVFPWDGVERRPEWDRNHTLRSAIQVSCVPCFQQVARKVGEPRMREWLGRLDYGNRDSSGKIDFFWLGGALRISPREQIDFLRRLDGGKLPISERTLDIVRDVFTLDVGADFVLRGKTGFAGPPEQPSDVAWFVGYVELGERRVFFATVLDEHPADVDVLKLRRALTEGVLRELGALPPS